MGELTVDTAAFPPGYPGEWEGDVVLRDGGTCHLRPIRPDDRDRLQAMHLRQSARSTYLRFFAPMPRLSERDLDRFTVVDYVERVALVAVVGDDIVAVGRYDVVTPGEAEVAFNVSDQHQGRGLGSVLLEHLAAAARERGITRFMAETLPENRAMVQVFREAGYEVSHRFDDGVITLEFAIHPTEKSIAVTAAREARAEANSLRALMSPRSVAVVGAGNRPGSIGQMIMSNLLFHGFTGPVYPVHPRETEVMGRKVYRTVTEIDEDIDLVVITTSAPHVEDVVRELPTGRVRGLLVLSDGFADVGEEGQARQDDLVRLARSRGMRLVGPGSLGMVNTHPEVMLNASLMAGVIPGGNLSVFTQSGGLGLVLIAELNQRGMGVAGFVSAGNRADVSGNDLLQFWAEDENTSLIAMYTETSGNPRKFSRIARRVSRTKPIVMVRSWAGGTARDRRSLAPRATFEALLRQAGVIRADDVHHQADVAQVLTYQPLPKGLRVGVLANAEILASLTVQAATAWGLDTATEQVLIPIKATAEDARRAFDETFARQDVDIVVATLMPAPTGFDLGVLRTIAEAAAEREKTCVACLVAPRATAQCESGGHVVPTYPTPEDAVRAVASVAHYSQWRATPESPLVDPPGCHPERARAVVEEALTASAHPAGVVLTQDQSTRLLAAYGITLCPLEVVFDAEHAVRAAAGMTYPVALKYNDRLLREREDLVGARLSIADEDELRAEFTDLQSLDHPAVAKGFVIQPMVPPGVPVAIRGLEDSLFGPVVSFGLFGDAIDLLGDVSHRICPLTTQDVCDMIREVKTSPRLFGHLGAPELDVKTLEDLLARVSKLCEDLPEVLELAMEPTLVTTDSVEPLWCRIRVALPPERETALVRKL